MASNAQRIRTQSLLDGFGGFGGFGATPSYNEENSNPSSPYTPGPSGLDAVAAQQDSGYDRDTSILGPDGQPIREQTQPSQQPNIEAPTIEAPKVDPNSGRSFKDYIATMNEGYTPDYASRDRLNSLLDSAPQRNKPSFGRALVAAGLSLKAQDPLGTSEKVMYAPFYRQAAEWKEKTEPFYKAAELENRQNINERTLMTNAATAYSAAERTAAQERAAADRNEVAMINARANQARSLGYKVSVVGTRLVGTRTVNGKVEKVDLGDSGKMDERDRILLQNEGKVDAATALSTGATGRAVASGGGIHQTADGRTWRLDENGNPVEIQYPPKGGGAPASTTGRITKPTAGGASAPNMLEQNRIEQSKINSMRTDYPETKKWTVPDGKGGYKFKERPVAHPDTWWPGDHVPESDVEEYDAARRMIDPNYVPPTKGLGPTGSAASPAAKTSPINPRNIPDPNDQTAAGDTGEGSPTAPPEAPIRYEKNKRDKNKIRRTRDNGVTWEVSTDGGRTWSK